MKAAAIVVGFNHWWGDTLDDKRFTRDFVVQLQAKNPALKVLLIDNASDKPYPTNVVETIRLTKRIGYGPALNVGLRWLERNDFDWYLTFNNDNWIDPLYKCDILDALALMNPKVLYGSGWNIDEKHGYRWQWSAWLAISREIFKTVGYFDPLLEGAFEDFDYQQRALDAGFCLDTAKFRITHLDEHTRYEDKEYPDRWEKSRLYFMEKHQKEMDRWFKIAKTA